MYYNMSDKRVVLAMVCDSIGMKCLHKNVFIDRKQVSNFQGSEGWKGNGE